MTSASAAIGAAIVAVVYSVVILSFGTYSLVKIWPSNSTQLAANTTVTIQVIGPSFSVGPETLLMLVMITVGALGACVFSLFAVAHHLGAQKDFDASWLTWYLVRPYVGSGLSLIFYFLIRGGVLSLGSSLQNLDLVVVAGLAGLVGMFSEQALHKLQDLADTLLGAAPGDGLSITNVTFIDPTTIDVIVRNAADTDASITDVYFNETPLNAEDISSKLPVTVSKTSSLTIRLTTPKMSSGQQCTIKLKTAKGAYIAHTATYNE
jgi:hypothetical protein